jgi:hypothetical protein
VTDPTVSLCSRSEDNGGDVDPCSLALTAVTSVAEYIFGMPPERYDLHISRAT